MYERVLIPTDGSADVQVAIDHGIKLARRFDAGDSRAFCS